MSGFNYQKDSDGIVTITMDMDGPVNAMNAQYRTLMSDTIAKLENEDGLSGVILASAKSTFFAGGDLKELLNNQPGDEEKIYHEVEATKNDLRRFEKLQVPVVAAINGAALGGGFEIALVCNHRVVWDGPKVIVGLPEVTLGLLPGAGGVVRTVHMLGLEKSLPYLTEGKKIKPAAALKAGLVDELVAEQDDLVPAAKAWIKANPDEWQQPWDKKGHRVPGGGPNSPKLAPMIQAAPAMMRKKTRGLLPSPERILDVAVESTVISFEAALRSESRGLAYLVTTKEAKNIISTLFFQLNKVNGGASRPADVAPTKVKKVGILGAGMMGQGVAYSSAMVGIEVILKDISQKSAEKGKAYTAKLLDKQIKKGHMDEAKKAEVLSLITPTAKNEDLEGCDLIIEAVFENIALKAKVTKETEPFLAKGGVYGSNTSTLPITQLAEASANPEKFIGIHFFSPVDKMPLVEIICGEKTDDETLAVAFDYARQIKKTPIVVNDSLGFFTSRVFGTFLDEGCRLLVEGVNPIVIDNLGRAVGMPVGPLAIQDEVSQELTRKVSETHREMGVLGDSHDASVGTEVCERMIAEHKRGGRYHGGGFYEYPADGPKYIWPELYKMFPAAKEEMDHDDIKDRLLFRSVVETLRCWDEKVLRSVADGNIGSIMGIGAPTWTGGYIQFVNTYGISKFVARALELTEKYGERFQPPAKVIEMAKTNERF